MNSQTRYEIVKKIVRGYAKWFIWDWDSVCYIEEFTKREQAESKVEELLNQETQREIVR